MRQGRSMGWTITWEPDCTEIILINVRTSLFDLIYSLITDIIITKTRMYAIHTFFSYSCILGNMYFFFGKDSTLKVSQKHR